MMKIPYVVFIYSFGLALSSLSAMENFPPDKKLMGEQKKLQEKAYLAYHINMAEIELLDARAVEAIASVLQLTKQGLELDAQFVKYYISGACFWQDLRLAIQAIQKQQDLFDIQAQAFARYIKLLRFFMIHGLSNIDIFFKDMSKEDVKKSYGPLVATFNPLSWAVAIDDRVRAKQLLRALPKLPKKSPSLVQRFCDYVITYFTVVLNPVDEQQDEESNTALHWAAAQERVALAKELLAYGARWTITNKAGVTAWDIAYSLGNIDVIKAIKEHLHRKLAVIALMRNKLPKDIIVEIMSYILPVASYIDARRKA